MEINIKKIAKELMFHIEVYKNEDIIQNEKEMLDIVMLILEKRI